MSDDTEILQIYAKKILNQKLIPPVFSASKSPHKSSDIDAVVKGDISRVYNQWYNTHGKDYNLHVLSSKQLIDKLGPGYSDYRGFYNAKKDEIGLKKDAPLTLLSLGLHEAAEREFNYGSMDLVRKVLGIKQHTPNLALRYGIVSWLHEVALGVQIMAVEKLERNLSLNGGLREQTLELLSDQNPSNKFVLDYLNCPSSFSKIHQKYGL